MWNNAQRLPAAVLPAVMMLLGAASLLAQDAAIPPGAVSFNLPGNSPLSLTSFTMADSRASARGSVLALDLHMPLTLRNDRDRKSTRLNSSHITISYAV